MKRETRELIENMDAEIGELRQQIADMTEARDAAAAASEYLRDKCDRQSFALKAISEYGEAHPAWTASVAKAALKGEW